MSLPIRLLGQLGYKHLEILRGIFPHLQQQKFTRIDNFYELFICHQTYRKMLANSSMKLLICHQLMRRNGKKLFQSQSKKEFYFFMAMINRIYRVLNPLPNSGVLVPRLISNHSFKQHSVSSIKFHEIYPIMAVASSSCTIWRINSDCTFENVSSTEHSFSMEVAFHPKLPILATGLSCGIVKLAKFNIDGTNAQILNTTTINKGNIWSIVFHPIQPVVFVSNDYGYLMSLKFTPDFRNLLSQSLLRHHGTTINGIAIQKNGRFLSTCSDDYIVKISTFTSTDCTEIKTVTSFGSFRKILCIDIHPTLDLIAIGGDDQTAQIWQIDENFRVTRINSLYHPSGVRCVQFDHFNLNIITGCYDGYVRIWNFEGKLIHQFKKPLSSCSSVISIGFSRNRPRIFAIGDNQEMTISKLEELKN
jgi:WD40 repeat protein